jgi:hypothetical protein
VNITPTEILNRRTAATLYMLGTYIKQDYCYVGYEEMGLGLGFLH